MSFNTSLSGLNAASTDLAVTSNNIANVGSIGFKESRAEFADVYALDPLSTANNSIGDGVMTADIRQKFTQGNLEFTDSSLDMAIAGRGFFVLADDLAGGSRSYSRAGAFGINSAGYVVNSAGRFLQGFPVNPDGTVTSTSLISAAEILVPENFGTPTATSDIALSANLAAGAPDLLIGGFNPADPTTYTNSTSLTAYDSLGNSHVISTYFIKTDTATNTWETRAYLDGAAITPTAAETLQFDTSGALTVPATGTVAYNAFALTNGANPMTLNLNYSGTSQYAAGFAMTGVTQDGNTTGRLASLNVSDTGVVFANYSNGEQLAISKVAMADFTNNQGLRQLGGTRWEETIDSGPAIAGEAGSGRFGGIEGGALESSNVELTEQLVRLITAQRNFQANAKAIETANSINQTIINL